MSSSSGRWLPLESNPDMLNAFAARLGAPAGWAFGDVYGTDAELLGFVPRPVGAVVLLFPMTDNIRAAKEAQRARVEADKQPGLPAQGSASAPFYLTQHDGLGNACGTIACIHALANCRALGLGPKEGSALEGFLAKADAMDAAARGWALAEAHEVHKASESEASGEHGQTACPDRDDKVDHHFIAFVHAGGRLVECDGRKVGPIDHGASTPETLLEDACKAIKANFIDVDPTNLGFNIMALSRVD
jgi:ubiquitin carboxyl-terminal hydrolase L3|uniref:Ubiquitin carboxyl-terminal hydrolase n=1 Tax=Prasinoderma singulare TaxID=676789 RepID=A0A7S3F6L9_9VIRI|mmetsp:Transcript_11424/g.35293  ORF Transcript_11424/g.35293 Transcript_11424/m.35293 type:complete len:246 (+) Transcript_11424:116-853(+)|eukprot:CAMPEP_0119166256 /NCGR_PEP_ID=MMETSP1315-20130426/5726_1 /TAXON_ID=676789 /ORGANISM="Prasinoderma singularis, Strain RCC927" /LENGTH=245 /DNA_ID=CAMNT_0007159623 /DNA_START=101 /DNA_END=838 /DNA_ORIENTATION=-